MGNQIARCVIAGGNGQVGRMFARLLVGSEIDVIVIDTAIPPEDDRISQIRYEQGDITAPLGHITQAIARADLVLLTLPESVALDAIPSLAAIMKKGALLADTLSVKSHLIPLVRNQVKNLEVISLNPMFSPSLEIIGRPVAVMTLVDGPRAQALRELLSAWGVIVVPIEPTNHDNLTAALQVATHAAILAFGLTLRELDIDISDLYMLAPPPHLAMLAMLARIASGVPEVYWDIQVGNPKASEVRAALQHGIQRISTLADDGDEEGFALLLTQLKTLLGDKSTSLAEMCSQMFERLIPKREEGGEYA